MKFTDLLKHETVEKIVEDATMVEEALFEEAKTPQEILRGANFKIKLITPTLFGTQITFAKEYSKESIEKILDGLKLKYINDNKYIRDIFIVD